MAEGYARINGKLYKIHDIDIDFAEPPYYHSRLNNFSPVIHGHRNPDFRVWAMRQLLGAKMQRFYERKLSDWMWNRLKRGKPISM